MITKVHQLSFSYSLQQSSSEFQYLHSDNDEQDQNAKLGFDKSEIRNQSNESLIKHSLHCNQTAQYFVHKHDHSLFVVQRNVMKADVQKVKSAADWRGWKHSRDH